MVRTMNEEGFRRYLKRGGRSQSAANRAVARVKEFERYLKEERRGKELNAADPEDLEGFVSWVETETSAGAKTHLWGIRYYYRYASNERMANWAGELRRQRVEKPPFRLKEFRGVNPDCIRKLEAAGVRNVRDMIDAGRTRNARKELSAKTGVPIDAVLELVKLSDLARIPSLKGIRARLYYDAGADTIEKLAQWDAEKLRTMLNAFVERTRFDGIAPLSKEVKSTVETAKRLPKNVEY
jgi:hypothetical protein